MSACDLVETPTETENSLLTAGCSSSEVEMCVGRYGDIALLKGTLQQ